MVQIIIILSFIALAFFVLYVEKHKDFLNAKNDSEFWQSSYRSEKQEKIKVLHDAAKLNEIKNKQIDDGHRQLLNFASEMNYYKKEHEKVCSALQSAIKEVERKALVLKNIEARNKHLTEKISRLSIAGSKVVQYKGNKTQNLKKLENEFMHIVGEPTENFEIEVVISKPMSSDELKAQTLST